MSILFLYRSKNNKKNAAHLLCASDQPDRVLRVGTQLEVEQSTERLLLTAEPSRRHVAVAHSLGRDASTLKKNLGNANFTFCKEKRIAEILNLGLKVYNVMLRNFVYHLIICPKWILSILLAPHFLRLAQLFRGTNLIIFRTSFTLLW